MSLVKNSVVVGSAGIQTYLKNGNHIHTESVEEWVLLEEQNLIANTPYYLRLNYLNFSLRLVSLWSNTSGNIVLGLNNASGLFQSLTITPAQSNAGINFPSIILPSNLALSIVPSAATNNLFMAFKEISVSESLTLTRQ